MEKKPNKYGTLCIYLALAITTFGVYWQVLDFDFLNYDDLDYVVQNQHVTSGLSGDNIESIIGKVLQNRNNTTLPSTILSKPVN